MRTVFQALITSIKFKKDNNTIEKNHEFDLKSKIKNYYYYYG
jgi:hypothetical protein